MTKAPERIVVNPCQLSTHGNDVDWSNGDWNVPGYTMIDGTQYIRSDLHAELMRAADGLASHVEAVAEWMRSNGYDDDADQDALTAYQQAKEKINE